MITFHCKAVLILYAIVTSKIIKCLDFSFPDAARIRILERKFNYRKLERIKVCQMP